VYSSPHIVRSDDLKGLSTKRYSLVKKLQSKIRIDGTTSTTVSIEGRNLEMT
jgi:hypothetical protein